MRFSPVEMDKEGSIYFQRFSGTSSPMLAAGLFNTLSETGGPYQDFPDDIATDIEALDAGYYTTGLKFVDSLADPVGTLISSNVCYTATVPADAT